MSRTHAITAWHLTGRPASLACGRDPGGVLNQPTKLACEDPDRWGRYEAVPADVCRSCLRALGLEAEVA